MFRNVLFTNRGTIGAASIDRMIMMMAEAEAATDVTCYFVIPTEVKRRTLDIWSEPPGAYTPLPDRSQVDEWIRTMTEAAAAAKVRCKAYCVASDSPEKLVFAAAERFGCDAIAIASETDDITLLNLQI